MIKFNYLTLNLWFGELTEITMWPYAPRGGCRLVGRGVSVSHSHMLFYLRSGGRWVGLDDMCRSTYRRVNIRWLLILQSLY